MNFGQALEALKNGFRTARRGWNGHGMFLYLVKGGAFLVNREPLLSLVGKDTPMKYASHIDIRTADGTLAPWTASQADLLADDWIVLS